MEILKLVIYSFFFFLAYCQVDLQAQARAHRIGQKRDVLVLRFETVSSFPIGLTCQT